MEHLQENGGYDEINFDFLNEDEPQRYTFVEQYFIPYVFGLY